MRCLPAWMTDVGFSGVGPRRVCLPLRKIYPLEDGHWRPDEVEGNPLALETGLAFVLLDVAQ